MKKRKFSSLVFPLRITLSLLSLTAQENCWENPIILSMEFSSCYMRKYRNWNLTSAIHWMPLWEPVHRSSPRAGGGGGGKQIRWNLFHSLRPHQQVLRAPDGPSTKAWGKPRRASSMAGVCLPTCPWLRSEWLDQHLTEAAPAGLEVVFGAKTTVSHLPLARPFSNFSLSLLCHLICTTTLR